MARILVSLVSAQTIPNFLFIKQHLGIDKYLFISTDEMENPKTGNKREWIITAAKIKDKSDKIIVDAEHKEDVIIKLEEYEWSLFNEIIVNITGGTKMMSIAAYEFFKERTQNVWYLPIGKDEYHLCDNSNKKLQITYKANVEEYLDCCGISKNEKRYSEKKPLFDKEYVGNFYEKYINKKIKIEDLENIRLKFRSDDAHFQKEFKKRKKISLNLIEDFQPIKVFLKKILFPVENDILTKDQMEFLTGGWFEEYVYYKFKELSNLSSEYFKIGVVLNPKSGDEEKAKYFTNNDLDVLFVNNNTLYVIECKSAGMESTDLYNKTVYLASALKKYFGLNVQSVLCTLSDMNDDKKEKAETLGVKVIARDIFISPNSKEKIAKKITIKI